MLQTVIAEKVDEKNGVTCLVIMFPSDLWSFNCPRVYLLQFCADRSSKSKYVNATYINAPESSLYSLWENDMVYSGLNNRSRDISD